MLKIQEAHDKMKTKLTQLGVSLEPAHNAVDRPGAVHVGVGLGGVKVDFDQTGDCIACAKHR
jgi:hypothetical protein